MGMRFESKHKQKLEISSANGIQQSCQRITSNDISNNKQQEVFEIMVNLYHKKFFTG
jgi:hypothetical protein